MNLLVWLGHFVRDLRFGARNLARSRAFSAIAIGSLALGIGGSTAMYSVIYGVIIDPFVYKDVNRLVSVNVRYPQRGGNGSYYTIDQFVEIAQRNSVFEGTIASTWSDVTWTGAGEPQRLRGNHCTMNTFDIMGVPPLIGRTTLASDATEDAAPVAVLGYKFWQQQFGGDPAVLGRKMKLNGKVRTVIGVMPRRFMWRGADVYLPDVFHRGEDIEGEREVHLMARLKPGVTFAQAKADLHGIIADLAQREPQDFPAGWRIELYTFPQTFPSSITDALWILFGAVGLLLLIACVNVSNLLLSKMASRRREIAVRASLGASRARLISQLLSESLVLAVSGGALGILAAYGGLRGIIAMVPPQTIPDEAQISLNAPVLGFTLLVSVVAAVASGLAPALRASGRDITTPLKEAGRGLSAARGQRILQAALVAGEVAISLMLLVGASLMMRTLLSIQGHLGLRADRVLTLRIPFAQDRYPDAARRVAFLKDVLQRVQSVPGVAAAGIDTGLPPIYNWSMPAEMEGSSQLDRRPVLVDQTSAGYLKAMGFSLSRGEFFSDQEVAAGVHKAVVNEAFATRYSAGREVIGRMVRLPRLANPPARLKNTSFQIAGVVKNTLNRISTREIIPEIYIPYTLAGMADRLYVAGEIPPYSLDKPVREQIYAVDRDQPVTETKPLSAFLDDYVYAPPRFNLLLFAVFAALGLTLALFGVYGVISNTVAQRTREIGIRLALGASYREVIGMMLAVGARLVAIGVAAGLLGSLAGVRVLAAIVHNVSPFDPYTFAAVTGLLFAAGLFASFWPARRAARVDPVAALREE